MQENTNKAIAVNTVILYGQLAITIITGLLTTRFALKALGVDDFGLFSVIGSIISIVTIVNSVMLSTSNRFIAVAIGRGDKVEVNEQFNVNLTIHIAIGILVLVFAFPIGHWYIHNYVNYIGDINNVITLFDITIIGTIFAVLGVPYNGVMTARERFLPFSIIVSVKNILRIVLAYSLQFWAGNKLFLYGTGLSVLEAIPTFIFMIYCFSKFPEIVRFRFVHEWKKYKEMLSFSIWVGYGAIAYLAKSSGSSLIVNVFFNTAMNAALGVANSVNIALGNLSTNVTKSIAPQITKSYAAGNKERSESLVCLASKASFMITFLVSTPFLLAPEYIFELWLDKVPPFAVTFAVLIILDTLIGVLNAGASDIIMASGNIKWYQIIDQSLKMLSVVAGYFVLKVGAPAYSLYIVYIIYTIISIVVRQLLLKRLINFDTKIIVKESLLPSLYVSVAFLPVIALRLIGVHPLVLIIGGGVYSSILVYYLGLSSKEKSYVKDWVKKLYKRRR